ncbi:MAG: hypothetical protein K2P78_07000, partial [Gemmataceae bacterium]|nr:hypothetical protein [Gemmataceae bacterium]
MPSTPLAYFITFSTYGAWLHGRAPGSVDREHNQSDTPFLPADPDREHSARLVMAEPPYLLDRDRREVTLRTILEVAHHRRWLIHAAHTRSNHVHVV